MCLDDAYLAEVFLDCPWISCWIVPVLLEAVYGLRVFCDWICGDWYWLIPVALVYAEEPFCMLLTF